jgi:protocatechuate 3,4-dioxygenase beta subunit
MFKKFIIFTVIIVFTLGESLAAETMSCPTTPELWSVGILPQAKNYNDLTKNYDSFEVAKGKKIIIKGKVLDKDCVPISGAKVSIWQANSMGYYQLNVSDEYNEKYDPNFAESGNIISNNLGEFEFITVYPGKVNAVTPNIIFKVEHQNFQPMETKMFFPENNNVKDIKILAPYLIKEQIPLINAKINGKIDNKVIYYFRSTKFIQRILNN